MARSLRLRGYGWGISLAFHGALLLLLSRFAPLPPPAGQPSKGATLTLRLISSPPRRQPETVKAEAAPRPAPPRNAPPQIAPQPLPDRQPAAARASEGKTSSPGQVVASSDLQLPPLPSKTPKTPPAGLGIGPSRPTGASGAGKWGRSFSSRGGGREEALSRHGGNPGTEDAVQKGLAWLAAHQDADGKWDAEGFNRHCSHPTHCPGKGDPQFNPGITALALLAFLGAGFDPEAESPYQKTVEKGLNFLISSQDSSGLFGPPGSQYFYNHSLATFALAEASGMSRRPKYLEAAARALAFSAAGQQAGGGWDYTAEPTGRNDLSITGWQVLALRTAEELAIPFPTAMTNRVQGYLERCVFEDGRAEYANIGIGQGRQGCNMAAVGMLCRLYFGARPASAEIQGAVKILLRNPPDMQKSFDWDKTYQSSYYWYYATLALFHLGGPPWEAWNHFIQKTLLPLQSTRVHEAGSWNADGNWIGTLGGRVTATALLVLTFEVYYRYPPLHAYRGK